MIKSHVMNLEAGLEETSRRYNRRLSEVPERISKRPSNILPTFAEQATDLLVFESLAHGGTQLAWNVLAEGAQLKAAYFQTVLADGQDIEIHYRDQVIETVGQYSPYYTSVVDWFEPLWLAIMARDSHIQAILAGVDASVFENARGGGPTAYKLRLSEFYKGLITGASDLIGLRQKAMDALTTEGVGPQTLQYEVDILASTLAVLGSVLHEEGEAAYNDVLREAILRHQQFWQTYAPEKSQGYISCPLTAVAVIAHDRAGYRVTVESDYVLDWVAHNTPPQDV